MEQLVELLKQIQELAGVAIEALESAGGEKPEGGAEGGAPAGEGGPPPSDQMAAGRGGPPPEEQ